MSKFMYLYRGHEVEMSPEFGAAWGAWAGKVGAGLVDEGAPFATSGVVVDDGSTAKATNFTGYTIIEAPNLASAQALTTGHPLLSAKAGKQSIEIFELGAM
ncbi:MAG: hypothetical protein WCP64_04265 [Actinomycetes bacterium]